MHTKIAFKYVHSCFYKRKKQSTHRRTYTLHVSNVVLVVFVEGQQDVTLCRSEPWILRSRVHHRVCLQYARRSKDLKHAPPPPNSDFPSLRPKHASATEDNGADKVSCLLPVFEVARSPDNSHVSFVVRRCHVDECLELARWVRIRRSEDWETLLG